MFGLWSEGRVLKHNVYVIHPRFYVLIKEWDLRLGSGKVIGSVCPHSVIWEPHLLPTMGIWTLEGSSKDWMGTQQFLVHIGYWVSSPSPWKTQEPQETWCSNMGLVRR
jgi:hypothetical protein